MPVGLTYDLRDDYLAEGFGEEETAEFDRPDTIDAIESALRSLGYVTDRIGHARALVARLAAGDRWDVVFNIAEGMRGVGRESQVPALLDIYGIPYTFSDPVVLGISLHKGMTKRVLRDAGLPTPEFVVVEGPEDVAEVRIPPPLFVKPVAEGTGKGITASSRIDDAGALAAACRDLIARFRQPVLVERFLPGRELTVGVVGTGRDAEALGTLEVALLPGAEVQAYSYTNKEHCESLVDYRLVADDAARQAESLALAAWRTLGCRDAGRVDLRADERGLLQILEVNPLAGLHPAHSDLPILCSRIGMAYEVLIDRIMRSALARARIEPPADVAAGRG